MSQNSLGWMGGGGLGGECVGCDCCGVFCHEVGRVRVAGQARCGRSCPAEAARCMTPAQHDHAPCTVHWYHQGKEGSSR